MSSLARLFEPNFAPTRGIASFILRENSGASLDVARDVTTPFGETAPRERRKAFREEEREGEDGSGGVSSSSWPGGVGLNTLAIRIACEFPNVVKLSAESL
jgi:hypothetical protein